MSLNVLSIGLDTSLLLPPEKTIGDSLERQKKFARHLGSYHIIIKSPRQGNFRVMKPAPNLTLYPTSSLNRYSFFFDALRIAERIIRENPIDLITTQDPAVCGLVGTVLKKKYKIPLNVQDHSNAFGSLKQRFFSGLQFLFYLIGQFVIKQADTIRVVTSREQSAVIKAGVPKESVFLLPVMVNPERFHTQGHSALRKRLLGKKADRIVLFVGRFSTEKNIPLLLKTAACLLHDRPQTLFVVAGSGPNEKKIRSIAEKLKISGSIIFPGAIAHRNLPVWYNACDIFLLTSYFEGTGLVMIEAGLSARPVVVTDVGGADDVIQNGKTGWVIPKATPEKIAGKLLELLSDPDRLRRMGADASRYVRKKFHPDRIISQMMEMYRATAKKK
jgi:glycosyltransferase involved in cell wall biosynthesis